MRRHASWQFGQLALGWRSRSKFADLFESTLLHSTADLIDFPLPRDAEIRPMGHVRRPAVVGSGTFPSTRTLQRVRF